MIALAAQVKACRMEGLGHYNGAGLRAGEVAGALEWWTEAGVDLDFADEAQAWLAAPEPDEPVRGARPLAVPELEPAPEARIGGDAATWPQDLAVFKQWWLDEFQLDGPARGHVAPRGEAGARLMIVVGQPEAEDGEELLSGPAGRMLSAMLAAMGIAPQEAYVAAALPRHMPVPDWAGFGRRGLGEVLHHHVGLVAPQRLLVFGEGVLSLLGHDPAQSAQNPSQLTHQGRTMSVFGARELTLLARPAWKARFWRDWLDWTGTEAE